MLWLQATSQVLYTTAARLRMHRPQQVSASVPTMEDLGRCRPKGRPIEPEPSTVADLSATRRLMCCFAGIPPLNALRFLVADATVTSKSDEHRMQERLQPTCDVEPETAATSIYIQSAPRMQVEPTCIVTGARQPPPRQPPPPTNE